MFRESSTKIDGFAPSDLTNTVHLKSGRYGILVDYRNGDKWAKLAVGKDYIEVQYDDIAWIEDGKEQA